MASEGKNCDILFEYLRCILYEPEKAKLNIEELDEPFRKLGQGLQYLDKAVAEMKSCSAALANGNLSEFTPHPGNLLCDNLKGIYANMQHLTWQAKQVAKGDYSQDVSYLGDFSEAFNTMTAQIREREETLTGEALYDPLTHLGNRNYFSHRVKDLDMNGQEIALCYCDLDGLKYVNDTFGHAEGDVYIKSFANLLRKNTRGGDILARMGGDEFCVVLEDCSVKCAERRMRVIQQRFADSADGRYERCFSFGVVAVDCEKLAGAGSVSGNSGYAIAAGGDRIVTGGDAGRPMDVDGRSSVDAGSPTVEDENKMRSYWEAVMEQADEYMYRQKSEHKLHR